MSPELFGKYEAILLETTLESMADIILCPRCDALPINLAIKNSPFLLNIWSLLNIHVFWSGVEWSGAYSKLLILYHKEGFTLFPYNCSTFEARFAHKILIRIQVFSIHRDPGPGFYGQTE